MLELNPIKLNDEYRKKWNVSQSDFLHLCNDGVKINDSLYRVGMFGCNIKNDYFLLLKHVEAFYSDDIVKDKNKKPHLESQWCIVDKNGVEKVNFESFKSPYLQGGKIYAIDGKYYNIETGEYYGSSSHSMSTEKFIFINNQFHQDESKRGVLKINKADGSSELFN
jgi:hypothetical protein